MANPAFYTAQGTACSLTLLECLGSGGQKQVFPAASLCHLGVTLPLGTQQPSPLPGAWRDGAPCEMGLSRSSLHTGFCGSNSPFAIFAFCFADLPSPACTVP